MRRIVRSRLFIALAVTAAVPAVLAGTGPAGAVGNSPHGSQAAKEGQADHDADRADIRKVSEGLVGAFGAGDAKALADLWTAEGEFIADDGTIVSGRADLAEKYAGFFKESPGVRLDLEPGSVRFVARDAAVAEGFATLHRGPSEAPTTSRYSMLLAREDGRWRIALLREWPGEDASLRELAWLVGTWESKEGEGKASTTYEWEGDKAFLRSRFTVTLPEGTHTGSQMIGKDPAAGQLRSWTFDSDGGFGEATWSRDGGRWLVHASGTLADGGTMSATNIFSRVDADTFTWQTTERVVDGDELPDLPPSR